MCYELSRRTMTYLQEHNNNNNNNNKINTNLIVQKKNYHYGIKINLADIKDSLNSVFNINY